MKHSPLRVLVSLAALLIVILLSAPFFVPAEAADFPEKGRSITIIVGFAPGSNTDVGARLLAGPLEKELGVPVQVANKPGAGTQLAMTNLASAKADGYTIGYNPLVSLATAYLDPQRGAVFTAKNFEPIAMHIVDPNGFAVAANSPFKDMKDLLSAAKANPYKIKLSDFGIGGGGHLASLELQRITNAKFNLVHFDGGAPAITAMLGGHVDVYSGSVGAMVPQVKSGQLRALGVVDKVESKFLPGVKTLEAQGIALFVTSGRAILMPAGGKKDVMDKLAKVFRKIMENEQHKKAIFDTGQEVRYMDPAQTMAYWIDVEKQIKPMIEIMLKETK
jgi:tripartite-type tricarboxylate transporter receptor subunit TctC